MSTRSGIDGLQGIVTLAGLHGTLRGIISPDLDVWDAIPDAEIVAVPVAAEEVRAVIVDASRRVVRQVTHEEVERQAGQPGALSGRTDAQGRFAIASKEQGAWRIYACFRAIQPAGSPKPAPLPREVCFEMGAFASSQPIGLAIPQSLYCTLKRLADQWTLYGRLTACGTDRDITGATVSAFDTDWLQDDALGSGVTNASGVYRIDYPGSKFRKGTFLDVELYGGPDVYFKVADSSSNVLLQEPSIAGRGKGRADRGCCARVDLCAKVGVEGGGNPPGGSDPGLANAWTKVGEHYIIPDASNLNGFDATGYLEPGNYALGGVATLKGDVARHASNGDPIEYRFLVSGAPTSNGGPAPAPASFTRIVGEGAGAPLFSGVEVGQMVRLSPLRIVSIDAQIGDLRPGGWLRLEDCINRVFTTTPGLTLADLPNFIWNPNNSLMGLNTGALTSAPSVPAGASSPGAAVPVADHIPLERAALRFEIRSVDGANVGTPVGGNGTTLNSVVVNNNPVYMAFAVHDGSGTVTCDPAHGTVTLAYTAYHPELLQVHLHVESNSHAVALDASPVSGNTNLAVTESENPAVPMASPLIKCGYSAKLWAQRRMTDGTNYAPAEGPIESVFYYEP
jgi:hypothetical protein